MRLAIVALIALADIASADTYKLGAGAVLQGTHRCATPKAKSRLTDFVSKDPMVTIGHGQMTVTTDKPRGADRIIVGVHGVVHTGFWEGKPDSNGATTLVEIVIDTYGEATSSDGNKHQPEATVRIAQTFDGATCIEEWQGKANAVRDVR